MALELPSTDLHLTGHSDSVHGSTAMTGPGEMLEGISLGKVCLPSLARAQHLSGSPQVNL